MQVLQRSDFELLFEALTGRGYTIVGPRVRERAIVYDELRSSADLPVGWTDEQDGGHYRLRAPRRRGAVRLQRRPALVEALPAAARISGCGAPAASADGELTELDEPRRRHRATRSSGARSCELHAMGILDRVLGATRRERAPFVVAVQCGQAAATCFCVSMGTGPRAESGFDLALTEVLDGDGALLRRRGRAASAARRSCAELPTRAGAGDELAAADAAHANARRADGPRAWTRPTSATCCYRNLEHPRWDDVAERCLTCGNCTMVCPTCFCTSVEDVTDLAGEEVERVPALGLVLHRRLLAHPRRQRARARRARATGSG